MKARPILFSGPMVRALLEGRKTQTRRIVNLPHQNPLGQWEASTLGGVGCFEIVGGKRVPAPEDVCIWHTRTADIIACPYGRPGDLLWVRETIFQHGGPIEYAADAGMPSFKRRGTPSIHMPQYASRITLKISSVRVEQLQAISEEDARAEGMELRVCGNAMPQEEPPRSYRQGFVYTWADLHGSESWLQNPWVWVVGFTVEKRNVAELLREAP